MRDKYASPTYPFVFKSERSITVFIVSPSTAGIETTHERIGVQF